MQQHRQSEWLSEKDFSRSRTSYDLGDLKKALEPLTAAESPPRRLLDIGCGFGGLAALVGELVGAREVNGVDIDDRVAEEARSKGIDFRRSDAGTEPLPYPDDYFDMIMSLGMMDYLSIFDGMIREMNRVSVHGGAVLVSLPNLGSWNNRLALLLGYQPRDVEISNEVLVGVASRYVGQPAGHIHVPTVRAFTELMEHHGFKVVRVTGGRPRMNKVHPLLRLLDTVMTHRPSLARRFYCLARKVRASSHLETPKQATYQSLSG